MSKLIFPQNFLWGVSTSAYQIEGGYKSDGKGESIWDQFSHLPGNIVNNDNGDVACNHYHLFEKDIMLMKEMGVKGYRFSISWPRIFPGGTGKPNGRGLQFYKKLINMLLENNITPVATLYHWDLPQVLQAKGGWANRDVALYFEQYATFVFKELGDRIPIWITLNEPWVSSFVGYWFGSHPPGISDFPAALTAAHHILLAHGLAVRALKKLNLKSEIGIALNLNPVYPGSQKVEDVMAARRYGDFLNGWFLDPVLKGKYPEKLVRLLSGEMALPEIRSGDMEIINTPVDFLGVNSYSSTCVLNDAKDWPLQIKFAGTGKPKTDSGWEIYPEGLFDLLLFLHREYNGVKILISENGAAFKDRIGTDGMIDDADRMRYLHDHILQVHRALDIGVNLFGYFVWSFMDNFEWNLGYSKRFGLVYVDYATQKRTIKKSGWWYKGIIKNNSIDFDF
jgi:beta-glucosidase